MPVELERIARHIDAKVSGSASGIVIERLASISGATSGALVFAATETALQAALRSHATAVIAHMHPGNPVAKPVLVCFDPKLGFARAAECFHPIEPATGVHPRAVVLPDVQLAEGVFIGPNAVVSSGAVLGRGTRVDAGCYIGSKVSIGCDCVLHPNVTVYAGTSIGDRAVIHAGAVLGSDGFGFVRDARTGRYHKFPQQGMLRIGDDVEIGANTTVDRGALDETVIGNGVKLDNQVHIGHNVTVGENVVIAALTGISGSCVLEDNVIVGGQVGIGDHAHIEAGAILGSGSGVLPNKKVRGKGVVYWGIPARPLKEYLKETALLAKMARASASSERDRK